MSMTGTLTWNKEMRAAAKQRGQVLFAWGTDRQRGGIIMHTFATPERASQLETFLLTLRLGKTPSEAFAKAFGPAELPNSPSSTDSDGDPTDDHA